MRWDGTRALIAATVVWVPWAITPSVLSAAAEGERVSDLVRAQVGPLAEPYLRLAPPATVTYACLAPLLVVPVVCLLSSGELQGNRHQRIAPLARAALTSLLVWGLLYFAGATAALIADLVRGAEHDVAMSFWWRLAAYGFSATLPAWGFVLGARVAFAKRWHGVGVALVGSVLAASISLVLRVTHPHFPTPLMLRERVFSGRADDSSGALAILIVWGVGSVFVALATRMLASRSRAVHDGGASPAARGSEIEPVKNLG